MVYQSVPMGLGIVILLSALCFFLLASVLVPALWWLWTLVSPPLSRAACRGRHRRPQVVPVMTERRRGDYD